MMKRLEPVLPEAFRDIDLARIMWLVDGSPKLFLPSGLLACC